MANIDVVFRTGQPTMVLQDPEAVMQNEILNWRMHTAGTEVREVRIVFENPEATFFPQPATAPKLPLPPTNEIKKAVENGQTIWGQAPVYFTGGPPQSRPDKYTIEAFDKDGKRLEWATLDPTIRTDGP